MALRIAVGQSHIFVKVRSKMNPYKSLVLSAAIAVLPLTVFANPRVAVPPNQSTQLHLIKRIYIQKDDGKSDPKSLARMKLINAALKIDLTEVGFEVVEDAAKADAVMTRKAETWSQPRVIEPPSPAGYTRKYAYEYKLILPNGKKVWSFGYSFNYDTTTMTDESTPDLDATLFASKTLLQDWLKSAAKAGVKINGRVQ
jgi:hypothetical protein